MNSHRSASTVQRPAGITFLVAVNWIALILTLLFWSAVLLKRLVPAPGGLTELAERANAATTYGFLTADLAISAPLLLLAALGLRRLQFWGWTAAQAANALWIYSMTVIWMRDAYSVISPGAVLFTPFALIAAWAFAYLWTRRARFGAGG
jgi:hypothetical protein